MIARWKLWKWRLTFTAAKVVNVIGANSQIDKDEHVLMWDFDGIPLAKVKKALQFIQTHFELPEIRIFRTSPGTNYQAWCYKRVSWWKAKMIVARTHYVDEGFYRFAVFRGHFTLRTSDKQGRRIRLIATLPSKVPEDAHEFALISWTKYETLAK